MTSIRWTGHENDFAPLVNAPSSLNTSDVVAHDAGTTTSISINYHWRRLVVGAISHFIVEDNWDADDNDRITLAQFAHDLMSDFYD